MKFKHKKFIVAAVLLVTVFGIFAPHVTHAQIVDKIVDAAVCVGDLFSCAMSAGSVMLNSILGAFVALAAWFVRLALQYNANIVNSPAVQSGFGVSLAIANLGF